MRINVKILKGPDCSPTVSEETSVHELKQLVASALNIPIEKQRLVFKGKAMQDDMSLLHYGVTHDSRIFLSLKDAATMSGISSSSIDGACAFPSTSQAMSHHQQQADRSYNEKLDLHKELMPLLLRHFTPADAERVAAEFNNELKKMVSELSLDDIERLAKANLEKKS
jgi:hypothetical protein